MMNTCKYCERKMRVSSRSYAENPYCSKCLKERLEKASKESGPYEAVFDGGWARLEPIKYYI